MLKNREFRIRVAKADKIKDDLDENVDTTIGEKLFAAEQYSKIGQEFIAGVATTVLTTAVAIIAFKAGTDILKIGLKSITK